jgi:hypothetical protein
MAAIRPAESTTTHVAEDEPKMEKQNLLLVQRRRPISDTVTNLTNPVTNTPSASPLPPRQHKGQEEIIPKSARTSHLVSLFAEQTPDLS